VPRIHYTFTNNNAFGVGLYCIVGPAGTPLKHQGDVAPGTSWGFFCDVPVGTEWHIVNSETRANWDRYNTTGDAVQSYVIRDYTFLTFINNTASTLSLSSVYSVLPQYNQPKSVAPFSQVTIRWLMALGTEWEIRDAQTGAINRKYLAFEQRYQSVPINPSPVVTPVVPPGGTTVVTPVLATPVVTPGETIYSGPIPDHPTVNPTLPTPVVRSAKDSIFNSRSFNIDVINLDFSIRERAGLTDKNQIRAAVYAALMVIFKTYTTTTEQVLVRWLALQVKQTRIEAARLALAEYDKWHTDPWSYQPPAGYDFPPYIIAPSNSPMWLTTSPNPPVLANQSWQSFLAGILSTNAWSPLNNPIFTGGQRNPSLECVIGFPVFGTVLAYQKLYGTDEGVRILANTTKNVSTKTFSLSRLTDALMAGTPALGALPSLSLGQSSPFMQRQIREFGIELAKRAAGTSSFSPESMDVLQTLSTKELKAGLQRMTTGHFLDTFVCTFVLALALQALITETIMLSAKVRLRDKLVENLEKQRSATINLGNLLYYDMRGDYVVWPSDYQPTDPVELERMMGSREVYLAFLLATIE